MSTLRPYQTIILEKAREAMRRGVKRICLVAPTGAGKTLLTTHMLKTSAGKGLRSWFVNHRIELIRQSSKAFSSEKLPYAIIAPGFMRDDRQIVQIASVQTLARRLHKLRQPSLVIWDECVHIAAKSWGAIFKSLPNAFHIGLTAVPSRLDGRGLGEYFDKIIEGPSVASLIKDGFLSPYKLYAPAAQSLVGVHSRMGDYVASELSQIMDKPRIVGNAISEYKKHAFGKRAIARGVSIQHSRHIADQFNAAGIAARHVDGDTEPKERQWAMDALERGEIKVLTNVSLYEEGINIPSVECVLDLRPTKSLSMWLQFCGRALRTFPGKSHAIILDFGNNCVTHGLPDEERIWTLDGIAKKKYSEESEGASVKVCPACFAAQFIGKPVCQYCGHIFDLKPRKVEHVDGELVEADVEAIRRARNREQGSAQTYQDLVSLGYKRKYRYPEKWAAMLFKARQAKKMGITA